MARTWEYMGDVNTLAYGGQWVRHVSERIYHVVEIINMDDACGSDNEGQPTYVCELSEVDFAQLSEKNLADVRSSMGTENEIEELWFALEVARYGCKAPLWSDSGNNGWNLVRAAKRESRMLSEDSEAREERLSRPVNAMGSTALEYMRGDFDSALSRGLASGDRVCGVMAQMSRPIPQSLSMNVKMSEVPSDDPLAFVMGFMDGFKGSELPQVEDGDSLAEGYLKGREMGAEVRTGKREVPSWVS